MELINDFHEKYGLTIIDNQRYYKLDCNSKLYGTELENSIPYFFGYDQLKIKTSKWNQLTLQIVSWLLEQNPKSDEELLSLKYSFSSAPVFSKEAKTNFTKINNLYLNTNHSAGHSFRSIQELLTFFGANLSKCNFLIKTHISAEPEEVKTYFRNITMDQYKKYLKYIGFEDSKADKYVSNVGTMNKYFSKMNSSFDDLFLFEDYTYFQNYENKFIEFINKKSHDDKFIKGCKNNLKYLDGFYRSRNIIQKIEDINIDSIKEKIISEVEHLFAVMKSYVISTNKLYSVMNLKYDDEMEQLGALNNSDDFFQLCDLLLNKKYLCKKPFISKYFNAILTNDEIIKKHAYRLDKITVKELSNFSDRMQIDRLDNILSFFDEVSDDYVQTDVDTLINKNVLKLDAESLEKIKNEIEFYINSNGQINTETYLGYSLLPSIGYNWNKYLLAGIIRSYLKDYFKIENTASTYNSTDFIIKKE